MGGEWKQGSCIWEGVSLWPGTCRERESHSKASEQEKAPQAFALDIYINVSGLVSHRPAHLPVARVMCRCLSGHPKCMTEEPCDSHSLGRDHSALPVFWCHFWESLQRPPRWRCARPVWWETPDPFHSLDCQEPLVSELERSWGSRNQRPRKISVCTGTIIGGTGWTVHSRLYPLISWYVCFQFSSYM